MTLTPDLVAETWRLFKNQEISDVEAARLARLLGSREELVAALLFDEEVLCKYPNFKNILTNVARVNCVNYSIQRPTMGDAKQRHRLEIERELALSKFIAGEAARFEAANEVHEAIRALARHDGDAAMRHGYQWIVKPS